MPLSNLAHAPRSGRALPVLLTAAALALAACGDPVLPTAATPRTPVRAASEALPTGLASAASPALLVVPASVTITQGRVFPLRAINVDPISTKQANAPVTWSSSNPAVATVSRSGELRAVGAGTAIITATTMERQFVATSTITVDPRPNCSAPTPLPVTFPTGIAPIPTGYEDTPNIFRLRVIGDPDPCHQYTFTIPENVISGTLYQVGENGMPRLDAIITTGATVTNSEGWVAYYPKPGYSGVDAFRYGVRDESGRSNGFPQFVAFEILSVNDAPLVTASTHTGDNNISTANVLVLIQDLDNLTQDIQTCIAELPRNGDLYWNAVAPGNLVKKGECNPSRSLRYLSRVEGIFACGYTVQPPSSWPHLDSFKWYATDGSAFSDTVSGTIRIRYVNQPPKYTGPTAVGTTEDTPVAFTMSATDVDGNFLTTTIHTAPKHGILVRSDGTQILSYPSLVLVPERLTYVPDADFNTLTQSDDIRIEVSDGEPNQCINTIRFEVDAVNDAPTIQAPISITDDGSAAGTTFNGIIVSDDARPTDVLAVTLRAQGPAAAAVALADPTGFSWMRVSPTELRFEGTLARINALLFRGVHWRSNGPGPNSGALHIIVDDGGNFGRGGRQIGTRIVAVDVPSDSDGGLEGMRAPPPAGATVKKGAGSVRH